MTPEKIMGLRKILGLSRRELANLLCISETAVFRWETGTNSPTGFYLAVLKGLSKGVHRAVIKQELAGLSEELARRGALAAVSKILQSIIKERR